MNTPIYALSCPIDAIHEVAACVNYHWSLRLQSSIKRYRLLLMLNVKLLVKRCMHTA